MNRDTALGLLGIDAGDDDERIEAALLDKVRLLEQRASEAPTTALKDKYRRQLDELEQARTVLLPPPAQAGSLSQTMIGDLPLAQAAYTRGGQPAAAGAGRGLGLRQGQVLSGRYELKEQIGAGGMGVVYRAFDRLRDKDIAIKVLLPQLVSSPKMRERFMREARLASELSHPNIATVFDVQQDGAHCFLTMEILRGTTLRERLKALKETRRQMPLDEALSIADQACLALAHAHERTVHRDIKPENIWLSQDGRVKLMDFGIAVPVDQDQAAATRMDAGTPYYMAPEQLDGSAVDGRADQYALAATLHEMLTGRVPAGRMESLRKLRPDAPRALASAVDRALSHSPSQRHPDIESFRRSLAGRGLGIPEAVLRRVAIGAAAAAMAGAVVFTYPTWRAMLPDRDGERRVKEEAARLQGEAKALFRLVETQRRETRDAIADAERGLQRLSADRKSGTPSGDPLDAALEEGDARLKLEEARRLDAAFTAELDGPKGLVAIEGGMNAAEVALREGDSAGAVRKFGESLAALHGLREWPKAWQAARTKHRADVLHAMQGRWGIGTCQSPSTWLAKDPLIDVTWPSLGEARARVTQVEDGIVAATALTPASQRGRQYRYRPQSAQLMVEDLSNGRQVALLRCP